MKRPRGKPLPLTKVSKAVRLPQHSLSSRLERLLKAIDGVHTATNLRTVLVVMDTHIVGGEFDPGLSTINLNPSGSHLELSLLHEVGHYLEWRSIPKDQLGPRDFGADSRFSTWLYAINETGTIQHLYDLLTEQQKGSRSFNDIGYMLRPNEIWTRAYSCYIAYKGGFDVLFQQIAAENKVVTGSIRYAPYWSREEFMPIQMLMDIMFAELGWSE